jgi:hypothetical protein
MATTGHTLGDDEFVSYLLVGLGTDFDPMVFAVVARLEPITPDELYSQMLSHELRRDRQSDGDSSSNSSANMAVRGRGGPERFSRHGCGRGAMVRAHLVTSPTPSLLHPGLRMHLLGAPLPRVSSARPYNRHLLLLV